MNWEGSVGKAGGLEREAAKIQNAAYLGLEIVDDVLVMYSQHPSRQHTIPVAHQVQVGAVISRDVVDAAMTVVSPVPEIVDVELDQAGLSGIGHYAVLEGACEKVREDGEDAEDHFWPRMDANV